MAQDRSLEDIEIELLAIEQTITHLMSEWVKLNKEKNVIFLILQR